MVKKDKLNYKNFNVCQLIDKGKMKLQYPDNYEESKKTYNKVDKTKDLNCKTKKGTISNINKRIITGALTLALVATLSGCTKDFNYSRETKNGKYSVIVTGDIDFKTAGELKVIELKVSDENMLFLARCYDKNTNENGKQKKCYEYYDVFEDFKIITLTGENNEKVEDIVVEHEEINFVKEQSLEEYLIYYGYKNKDFSVDELKEIFEQIKKDYEFENDKKLIKGN